MSEHDELFTVPLPPPPHGVRAERDVVFFRHGAPGAPGEQGEREDEDIMLRRVPKATAQRFRASAGGRAMTHAQYLTALVELHEAMRKRADGGDAELLAELERLGLTTVTV
jgi:hypothetical protein